LILAACGLIGCGGGGGSSGETEHAKKLSEVYRSYVAANRGKKPANEAALKQYAKTLSPELLEIMKIDDVEAIFASPRDNQPYVVAYGAKATGPVIIHEQQGVDGKKIVATREGAVQEVEDAELQRLRAEK
jgi:hypothetical protein